jgi:hypothetical protein
MLISTALLLDSIISVIVYVLRQNCRAAGWRWDTKTVIIISIISIILYFQDLLWVPLSLVFVCKFLPDNMGKDGKLETNTYKVYTAKKLQKSL